MFFRTLARKTAMKRVKKNIKLTATEASGHASQLKLTANNTRRRKTVNQASWLLSSAVPSLMHAYNSPTLMQKRSYSVDAEATIKQQQADFFEETTAKLADELRLHGGKDKAALLKLDEIKKVYFELLDRLQNDPVFNMLIRDHNQRVSRDVNKVSVNLVVLKAAFVFGKSSDDVVKLLKSHTSRQQNIFNNISKIHHNICRSFRYSANINVWQSLSIKYVGSPVFIDEIINYMTDIEQYVANNMLSIKDGIRERITNEYKRKLLAEWTAIKDLSEEDYVNIELNALSKDIKKEVQDKMKLLMPADIKACLAINKKNRTADQEQLIATYMADPLTKENEEKIKHSLIESYRQKCREEFKRQESMFRSELGKNTFIEKRMAILQGDIKSACFDAESKVLSEYTTLTELAYYLAKHHALNAFKNDSEDFARAVLVFIENNSRYAFDAFLKLPVEEDTKQIPAARIDGATLNHPGFVIEKLQLHLLEEKAKAFLLGKLTGNCQSYGEAGEHAMIYGVSSKYAGFYVIRDKDQNIVAQCLAWRSEQGNIIFDSIEPQYSYREWPDVAMVIAMFRALAKELVHSHGVPCVKTGANHNISTDYHNPKKSSTVDTPRELLINASLYDSKVQYDFYENVSLDDGIKNSISSFKPSL